MKLTLSGRADLLRAVAADNSLPLATVAGLLGYEEMPDRFRPHRRSTTESATQSQSVSSADLELLYEPRDVPFWRVEAYEAISASDAPPRRSTRTPGDPLWRLRPRETPRFSPLAPYHRVLTQLRQVSGTRRYTREIDVDRLVDRMSRGVLLDDIPHRQRRSWGSRLHLIEDRSRRLVPYWLDQDRVIDSLLGLYPPSEVTIAQIADGDPHPMICWPEDQRGSYTFPAAGEFVLVLGDLGCLAKEGETLRRFWLDWGQRLYDYQIAAVALVPAQLRDIPSELAQTWTIVPWGSTSPASAPVFASSSMGAVEQLLTLLSPVVRLEPGLLRSLRQLVPEGRGNPGLEARVWQHQMIRSPHSVAATLDPELRESYQLRFAQLPRELRQQVIDLIQAWRTDLNAAVWFEEVVGLDRRSQNELIDGSDLDDAIAFFKSAAEKWPELRLLSVGTAAWIGRLAGRLPESACEDPEIKVAVHTIYDLVRPRGVTTTVPGWFDSASIPSSGQSVYPVHLWQVGDKLVIKTANAPSASEPLTCCGSLLAVVHTANGEVAVRGRQETPFWRSGVPPDWVHRWGHDACGAWTTLRIRDVEQRLRWIEPGQLWMGSPESEEGHNGREGPQHEVELSQGFWLFDTPCTQALWKAVMDENPSQFQGDNRPVETVSWDDCQVFISRLNDQIPGLELSLPSEAQWEYACRGGTQAARYGADLDAIAWYSENSGNETHDVAQKLPNAWGLYDMLGNVLEWVGDWYGAYTAEPAIDPNGPDAGAYRVLRGGLWGFSAQFVRAAYRFASDPGLRNRVFGFRCLSSGVSRVDGMRRARSQAESGARADRDRSDDGESPRKEGG